ncbi:YraN family protein [Acidihalobacter prosperus]|uniref:UPF0102 protein Thpro_021413 n=1 Tax=Acidihalobacter prosperus TaxID=160660 RepID=A0A1A6C3G6_9GAMM|nr:YraN family protein [Acidihalobacter prosperus]OBS09085.1 hypothetical protein Thpro_021413 [Acidihalobacter prosperus]
MAPPPRQGQDFEAQACDYLCRQGLRLRERNYRCRSGEIDLVMSDDGTLVFVEVRYRNSARFGGAATSVDAGKRRRLTATAQHYLQRHGADVPTRFDVVAMGPDGRIDWIPDAFQAQET